MFYVNCLENTYAIHKKNRKVKKVIANIDNEYYAIDFKNLTLVKINLDDYKIINILDEEIQMNKFYNLLSKHVNIYCNINGIPELKEILYYTGIEIATRNYGEYTSKLGELFMDYEDLYFEILQQMHSDIVNSQNQELKDVYKCIVFESLIVYYIFAVYELNQFVHILAIQDKEIKDIILQQANNILAMSEDLGEWFVKILTY